VGWLFGALSVGMTRGGHASVGVYRPRGFRLVAILHVSRDDIAQRGAHLRNIGPLPRRNSVESWHADQRISIINPFLHRVPEWGQ